MKPPILAGLLCASAVLFSPPPLRAATVATEKLLAGARDACESLDFDVCIVKAGDALKRPDLTQDQLVAAYTLQGAAYTVLGQIVEAERPYRLLLRLRPDFELGKDTPPKILAVFRKVQAEENEIRQAVKEAERRKIVQALKLDVAAPARHKGGTPLEVRAVVTDPFNGVASVVLEYRLDARAPFSSVPLQRKGDAFLFRFPATQLSTEKPARLQYLLVARDAAGEVLMTRGSPEAPLLVDVEAGQVSGPPLYRQGRFWAGVATLGAGGAVVAVLVVAAALVSSGALYLVLRGDNTPATTLGRHTL